MFFNCILTSLHAQQKQIQYLSGTDAKNTVSGISFAPQAATVASGKKYKYPVAGSSRALVIIIMAVIIKPMARMQGFMMRKGMYKYQFKVPASWKGKNGQYCV